MLVTLSGMAILDRALQLANALFPILVTLFGMTTSVKALQQLNAPSHIIFVLSLIM